MSAMNAKVDAVGDTFTRPSLGQLILLGGLSAFAPLSIDMYLPSLPALARDLHVTSATAQATLAAFLAGLALGQFLYGPASDRWGRRPPILIGAALYAIASIACMLAPSIGFLTAARFVQALGGCAGPVVVRAVVRDQFNTRDSARVLSMLMLIMGVAPIVAPLLGGALLTIGGWRVIFGLLSVIGVALTIAAFFGLRESRSAETAARARSEQPLRAYLTLISQSKMIGYVLSGGFNSAAMFAYISAAAGLLIGVYGVKPANFGWYFGANSLALIGMTQVNAHLLRRRTPDQIVALVRPVSIFFALLMVVDAKWGFGGMWGVLIPLFLILGSSGFVGPNTQAGALEVDPLRSGSVSALIGGATFGLGAAASALITALPVGGAMPMAATILGCILLSSAALHLLALPGRDRVTP